MKLQTRTATIKELKFRTAEDGSSIIEGYAAVFNSPSLPLYELGGRRELIRPGAFTGAMQRGDDVRLLINHDPNLIVARTPGTLALTQDEAGLYFSAKLGNQTYAQDLKESMRTGLLTQCSFAFEPTVQGIERIDGEEFMVIRDAGKLSDTSIVSFPAYPATVAMVRSLMRGISEADAKELLKELQHLNITDVPAVDSFELQKLQLELLTLDS